MGGADDDKYDSKLNRKKNAMDEIASDNEDELEEEDHEHEEVDHEEEGSGDEEEAYWFRTSLISNISSFQFIFTV